MQHRPGEGDAVGIPLVAEPVDGRPARISQTHEAGHLVEGLARGVVEGGAQHPVAQAVLHQHEHGVATRHQGHHHRQFDAGLIEEERVEMGLEVVDGHERHVPDERQRLCRRHADQQRPHQARSGRGPHRGDVGVVNARLRQRLRHYGDEPLDVGPARHLGDDAPVAGVQIDLARHHRRQHLLPAGDHRRGRLVAGRLDPQDRLARGKGPIGRARDRVACGHGPLPAHLASASGRRR